MNTYRIPSRQTISKLSNNNKPWSNSFASVNRSVKELNYDHIPIQMLDLTQIPKQEINDNVSVSAISGGMSRSKPVSNMNSGNETPYKPPIRSKTRQASIAAQGPLMAITHPEKISSQNIAQFDNTSYQLLASDGSSADKLPIANQSFDGIQQLQKALRVNKERSNSNSSGIIVTVPNSKIAMKAAAILKSKRLQQVNRARRTRHPDQGSGEMVRTKSIGECPSESKIEENVYYR